MSVVSCALGGGVAVALPCPLPFLTLRGWLKNDVLAHLDGVCPGGDALTCWRSVEGMKGRERWVKVGGMRETC